jgi:thiol-disulfide isomerase/thioredoxin
MSWATTLRRPMSPRWLYLMIGILAFVCLVWLFSFFRATDPLRSLRAQGKQEKAPDLVGGTDWLNTAKPLSIHKDLKGKIVILDFWTFCCINCIHTLPDLAKLEKKYANELVVIGVHSAKFANEKITANIRKAILRYQIRHPVVNDPDQKIWDSYNCESWPTLAVIDPEGNFLGIRQGEGNYDLLDRVIQKLIDKHRKNKTLNEEPIHFALERELEQPLNFPGKILADEKSRRLFIADSTNHRVVVTDFEGNKLAIAGIGGAGNKDGAFDQARFNDPQGMALKDEILYVADRKNHTIRALDLKDKTVRTVAGTGEQDRDSRGLGGPALKIGLNSPWDLLLGPDGNTIFIAMAGHHQIWTLDPKDERLDVHAGEGRENIKDGSLASAWFAQPSGLTTDGKELYVADSEVSAIRAVSFNFRGSVRTLVGKGLFIFGDKDGKGEAVRLQHALGVVYHDGKLYVADTYNSKIKVLDPKTSECKSFVGDKGGWLTERTFNEPGGISYAAGKLYVADTNAHRIRVVDLKTKAVTTLKLTGVPPVVSK